MNKSARKTSPSGRIQTWRNTANGKGPEKPRGRTPLPLIAMLMVLALSLWSGARWFSHRQVRGSSAAPVEAMGPAEQAVRAAAARAPRNADAHLAFGTFLLEQSRPYEAIWSFQDALELRPTDGEARRGLARALIAAGLPRLALSALGEGAA